jgi:hypothetical protein
MRGIWLSTLAVSAAATAVLGAPAALAADPPSVLTGDGHGKFQVTQTNIADAGTERVIRGRGDFSIGEAKIRGVVSAPGFVFEGSCHVAIRLVTDDGAVKVVGHSPVRSRSDDEPICDGRHFRFRFHTAKASGDLADADYKGVGIFDLKNAYADKGRFSLLLRVPRD